MDVNFSVALIAKNESKTLPRMIESLKEYQSRGGDIWVLDTGSTDNTIEVAKSFGCNVEAIGDRFIIKIDQEYADSINNYFIVGDEQPILKDGDKIFDFASARNYIADFTKFDMVATPDCDEIYTKLNIDKLCESINNGAEHFKYWFVFSHDELGNETIKFLHSKFYNRKKLKWVGVIHEVLCGVANKIHFEEDIIKLEHWQNPETNRSSYEKGLAIDCYEHPDNDRNCHYFGRELIWNRRPKSGIKLLRKHIDMNCWILERAQSLVYIGDAYGMLNEEENQIKSYFDSFIMDGSRREPLIRLAEFYYRRKSDYQKTACFASAALQIPLNGYYSNNKAHYTNVPHELLYWALWYLGDHKGSKYHYDKCYEYQPNNPKYIKERKFYYSPGNFNGGERFVPELRDTEIGTEHYTRYNFTKQFTKGLKILDAACGEGYGFLEMEQKDYLGIDVNEKVIKDAQNKYIVEQGSDLTVKFEVYNLEGDVNIDFKPDVTISFETIEHLENPNKFLEWVCYNSTVFICSIPINMPSEFHKHVYTVEQAKELLEQYFDSPIYYYQKGGIIDKDPNGVKYLIACCMPKISIVIPTLGRPEGLKSCLKSIDNLLYHQDKIEKIVIDGEGTVPEKMVKGVEQSTGEYVVYGSNDIEFTPESLTIALSEMRKQRASLVAFNTGTVIPDEGNICEHFIIRKSFIPRIGGQIFDTRFHHVGCDNLLWAKSKKLNQTYRSNLAIVNHYHFSIRKSDFDEVYGKGWSHIAEDRKLLAEELAKLIN